MRAHGPNMTGVTGTDNAILGKKKKKRFSLPLAIVISVRHATAFHLPLFLAPLPARRLRLAAARSVCSALQSREATVPAVVPMNILLYCYVIYAQGLELKAPTLHQPHHCVQLLVCSHQPGSFLYTCCISSKQRAPPQLESN